MVARDRTGWREDPKLATVAGGTRSKCSTLGCCCRGCLKGKKQLSHREERGKTGGVVGDRLPPRLGCWLVVSWLSSEGEGREEIREKTGGGGMMFLNGTRSNTHLNPNPSYIFYFFTYLFIYFSRFIFLRGPTKNSPSYAHTYFNKIIILIQTSLF